MSTCRLFVHISTSVPFPYINRSRLQLADEQTGGEQADALGQDVLGEDEDEGGEQDKGHGGLVDEEEGDQLGHGRLEDSMRSLASVLPVVIRLLGAPSAGGRPRGSSSAAGWRARGGP